MNGGVENANMKINFQNPTHANAIDVGLEPLDTVRRISKHLITGENKTEWSNNV